MGTRRFMDQQLRCADCGASFIFSAGEQELFALRGLSRQAERCPSCVRAHSTGSGRARR